MRRPLKSPVKYEKGVIYVTPSSCNTAKKADKAFREFYAWQVRHYEIARHGKADEKWVREVVEKNIAAFKENGFDLEDLEMYRRAYAELPRRGPRRKKVKKKLDANGLPIVGKTSLDNKVSAL